MEKTREEKIKEWKKSNVARREALAKKNGFKTGAEYLASLEKKIKVVQKNKTSKKKEMLDYIVAFDTTGSMGAYINNVKKHVEKLIPEMFDKGIDLKMKIIAFGDYCDMESSTKFGKAYQESNFTNDEDHLISFVKGAKNTAGGDSDEFYELVIKKITEETPWRTGAKRSVLFIADCNPHETWYSYFGEVRQIDWKKEAKKAADLNIAFNTLSIHGDSYPWYKELANITKGIYMPFQSSGKMGQVFAATAYATADTAASRTAFMSMAATATASGDTELIGTYKSLSSLMDEPTITASSTGTTFKTKTKK